MLSIYLVHLRKKLLRWLGVGCAVVVAGGVIWGGYVWFRPTPPTVNESEDRPPPGVTFVQDRLQWYPGSGPLMAPETFGGAMAVD